MAQSSVDVDDRAQGRQREKVRLAVLGTGSRGNSTLIEARETRVLIDAGFSGRDLERRLTVLGIEPESISAVVVTHDHGDHTRGVGVFARRYGTPVYVTDLTRTACSKLFRGPERLIPYRPGRPFEIGALRVEPFLTVHDAADPVGVAVVDVETGSRAGIATDLGRPTTQIRHALSRSDFLVLEANYDEAMLHAGAYPRSVKSRIASSHGHLSNRAAAQFVCELLHPHLAGVLLAHLSAECNKPELAFEVVRSALDRSGFRGYLGVAAQDHPSDLLDVENLRAEVGPAQYSFL